MVFATGAVTGIHAVRPGQHCRIEVRGGPALEVWTTDLSVAAPG
jgi:2-keto-4-pentenoate hydratase